MADALPRLPALPVERADAARNRALILATAERLFTKHGVEAVTMDQVARAAGIGPGTLYRRYPNKGALAEGIAVTWTLRLQDQVLTRLADTTRSPRSDLSWLLVRLVHYNEENAPLLAALAGSGGGTHQRRSAYVGPLYQWAHAVVTLLLRRAVDRGEIVRCDPEFVADALLSSVTIDLFLAQRARGWTVERIADGARWLLGRLTS
jgi:AcrR family transcriptional regulator